MTRIDNGTMGQQTDQIKAGENLLITYTRYNT